MDILENHASLLGPRCKAAKVEVQPDVLRGCGVAAFANRLQAGSRL